MPPEVIRGCPIKMIPNEETLNKERLVKTRVQCTKKSNLEPESCLPKESFIKYACQKGFIFENQKGKLSFTVFNYFFIPSKKCLHLENFYSLCADNGLWEHVPRCIKRNLF